MTREEDEARADDFFGFEEDDEGDAAAYGQESAQYPPPQPRAAKVRPLETADAMMCPNCSCEIDSASRFCPSCGAECDTGVESRLAQMQQRVVALESQVSRLGGALNQHADVVNADTGPSVVLPKTNLLSPSFWTRAFAVYGHSVAVGMLFAIPLWLFGFFISIMIPVFLNSVPRP